MNRGAHEGEVGVDIYYYDIEKNVVQEKAFIPSTKSFAIAEEELGKWCITIRIRIFCIFWQAESFTR